MNMHNLLWLLSIVATVLTATRHGFEFGIATSAMQIEGAWLEEGKTLTAWDNIAHTLGKVQDNTTADVTADSYHRFREDVALMKEYGIKHYRLSIAWTRVLPAGIVGASVNMLAVAHYRALLQILRQAGIIAYVNLYHNDIPAILAINGTGKMDADFVDQFKNYADVCFTHFGDLVPYWFTFDEPWCQSVYESTQPYDADTKPYLIAHNLLLAHSEAVQLYRSKYQSRFQGKVGVNLIGEMAWPFNESDPEDIKAAARTLAFQVDWFADPLFFGDYPEIMKRVVGSRLPAFTETQKLKLKGSLDFFAVNHYYSHLVKQGSRSTTPSYWTDLNVTKLYKPEWKRTDMDWPIVPEGLHDLLMYIYRRWIEHSPMEVWVTENGLAVYEPNITSALSDSLRVAFTHDYLQQAYLARLEGVPLTKYFAWSLLDNFEWGSGLAKRFGFVRVEYGNPIRRIPKASIKWYSQLLSS